MYKCQDFWTQCGLWKTICDVKPIFMEPKAKDDFHISINDYYESVKSSKGAIYMAVLRGKVSEGLDFNDHNARAVIVCGIPFPPMLDPRVILKKKYLDVSRNVTNQLQTGNEWYVLEAVRAVNQAIGRVIRHINDYGAILLCDKRFHMQRNQLSKWIQPHLSSQPCDETFGQIVGELAKFFRNASSQLSEQLKMKEENIKQKIEKSTASKKFLNEQMEFEYVNEASVNKAETNESGKFVQHLLQLNEKTEMERTGLFDNIIRDVSFINFNQPTSSGASTTGIKTSRICENSIDFENLSKKRRLTIIPNSNQVEDEESSSSLTKIQFNRRDYEKEVPVLKKEYIECVSKACI
jgi:hypothetical protein